MSPARRCAGRLFLTVLIVGLYVGRRKQNSAEGYFLAGRRLPWDAVGLSVVGSSISTEQYIGMAGAAGDEAKLAAASLGARKERFPRRQAEQQVFTLTPFAGEVSLEGNETIGWQCRERRPGSLVSGVGPVLKLRYNSLGLKQFDILQTSNFQAGQPSCDRAY